jgi:hypothetical protein
MIDRITDQMAEHSATLRDAVIGGGGTFVAVTMQGWQGAAAIFAGVSTGLWMLTQTALAIHARLKKPLKGQD